jgi:hypothetical protein
VSEQGAHIHLILPDPVERAACFRTLADRPGRIVRSFASGDAGSRRAPTPTARSCFSTGTSPAASAAKRCSAGSAGEATSPPSSPRAG